MTAKIYQLSPKGAAWLVYHRRWQGGGCTTNWAFVFNYGTGLTAHEAWQQARLAGNPPFHEVITEQLTPFPLSANTKQASDRSRVALEALQRRVENNGRAR